MKARIGLITLGVSDLARSLAFYRDGLGWPTHGYNPDADVVFFALEGTWLALYPRDKLAEDAGVQDGRGFGGITLAHNEPSPERVDLAYAEAVAAGAQPMNLWEIAFNPFMDLT
jgi:catechol 2,3-dioxygenase-like lactoylglutathione lyase family enzyme